MRLEMDNQSINSYDMAVENTDKTSGTSGIEDDGETEKLSYTKLSIRKTFSGVFLVIVIGALFSITTQYAKDTNSEDGNFTSVTFLSWITCSSLSCVFPIHAAFMMMFTGQSLPQIYKESMKIYPKENVIKFFWSRIFPIAVMYNLTAEFHYYALNFTAPADVTAVFASVLALVYVLSMIFLKEPLILIRVIAVCLSITGVVLFAYSDGFGSFAAIGVILAALLSLFAALFRVFTKIVIGDASSIQGSMYVTIASLFNIFIGWIPVVIFNLAGVEKMVWSQIPWGPLMLASLFNIFYTGLLVIGIGVTYPIFISLGALFGIPINAVVDIIARDQSFSYVKIIGTILLVFGFLILLIPLKLAQKISGKIIQLLTFRQVKPKV